MSFQPKFYRCAHCGQVISLLKDQGVPVFCCGEAMQRLTPNTTEAAVEKHLPVIEREGDKLTVKVGSAAHPMLPEHFIEWIYLHEKNGGHRKILQPGDAPQAVFCVEPDQALEVYAYCNLHGLWMTAV